MAKYKKILLTGINGQVGHALYPKLQSLGKVIALDRTQLDLSNPHAMRQAVQQHKPDLIVNPAAYTGVDKAETDSKMAHAINGTAPGILAEEAAKLNALLVHYSTDYVFDGHKSSPYLETDITNPLGVYGASKLAGENAIQQINGQHLIFRTSWVYGSYGKNFLRTILRLANEQDKISIVADQFGAPTSSDTIADATIAALENWDGSQSGIYHLVNSGIASWHLFAQTIVEQYSQQINDKNWPLLKASAENIVGISTEEYPTLAQRPKNSRMSTEKIANKFGITLPSWQDALFHTLNKPDFLI